MGRPPRPLTETERTKPCSFCGARPGERCRIPGGQLYGGVHVARRTGIPQRRPLTPPPDRAYQVDLCGACGHPGGQHIDGKGCRLCRDCPGWDEERRKRGEWSDRMTDELLAAPGGTAACRHCGQPIERCETPQGNPLCKGWRHAGYDSQPVMGHCCEGRMINPAAEPAEGGRS